MITDPDTYEAVQRLKTDVFELQQRAALLRTRVADLERLTLGLGCALGIVIVALVAAVMGL